MKVKTTKLEDSSSVRKIGESLKKNEEQKFAEESVKPAMQNSQLTGSAIASLERIGEELLNQAKTRAERDKIVNDLNESISSIKNGVISFRGIKIRRDGSASRMVEQRRRLFDTRNAEKVPIPSIRLTGFQWDMPIRSESATRRSSDSVPFTGGWSGRIWVGGKKMHPSTIPNGAKWIRVKILASGYTVTLETSDFPDTDFPGDEEWYDLAKTYGDIHCDRF